MSIELPYCSCGAQKYARKLDELRSTVRRGRHVVDALTVGLKELSQCFRLCDMRNGDDGDPMRTTTPPIIAGDGSMSAVSASVSNIGGAAAMPPAILTTFSQPSSAMPKPRVFLSYARGEVATRFARWCKSKLEEDGWEVWFDESSIASGADWMMEIGSAIESSSVCLHPSVYGQYSYRSCRCCRSSSERYTSSFPSLPTTTTMHTRMHSAFASITRLPPFPHASHCAAGDGVRD